MTTPTQKFCRSALLVLCIALSACAREGVVIDKGTKKPLAGAFVITVWFGNVSVGIESRSGCYSSQVTTTDSNGRFRFFPSLNPLNLTRHYTVYAYMPKYESPKQRSPGGAIPLELRQGTDSEKFAAVLRESLGGYCDGNEGDWSFLPARKAQLAELRSLARTPEEFKIVAGMLYGIEFVEFGEKIAIEREQLRIKNGTATSETPSRS